MSSSLSQEEEAKIGLNFVTSPPPPTPLSICVCLCLFVFVYLDTISATVVSVRHKTSGDAHAPHRSQLGHWANGNFPHKHTRIYTNTHNFTRIHLNTYIQKEEKVGVVALLTEICVN